jgi:hypothetical protein
VPESERIKVLDWMVLTCYPAELKRQLHAQDLKAADREAEDAHARKATDQRREEESRQIMD